jgi:hypothetical protein
LKEGEGLLLALLAAEQVLECVVIFCAGPCATA